MFKEADCFRLCSFGINKDDPKSRFSNDGKVLKSAWMLGPSKATLQYGKVFDSGSDTSNTDSSNNKDTEDSNKDSEDTNSGTEVTTSKQTAQSDDTNDNESFTHSYSMLEASYYLSHLVYEEDKDSTASNSDKSSDDSQPSADKSNTDSSAEPQDDFKAGNTYTFRVGIDGEGFTEWTLLFDSRVNIDQVKSLIRAKKFKQAYLVACQGLKTDGFIPISLKTYVVKKPEIPPAFIGHCRYGFDSGSEEEYDSSGAEDSLTIALAVAPINARTNKPDEKTVITAVYNVVGDITGGTLGRLLANVQKKIRDKADDRDSSYDRDYDDKDKDSEESKSEELSKFLHKKFRCTGDHTMYNDFKNIRKYIKEQISAGNLEFEDSTAIKNDWEPLKNKPAFF